MYTRAYLTYVHTGKMYTRAYLTYVHKGIPNICTQGYT